MTFMDVTMSGYAGRDVEQPETGPAARIRIAHTPRKRDDSTGEWSDNGSTIWVTVQCWDDKARSYGNLMRVKKGDQVVAIGKLTMNSWQDSDGNTRADLQMNHPEALHVVQKAESNGHAPDAMAEAGLAWDKTAQPDDGEQSTPDDDGEDLFAD